MLENLGVSGYVLWTGQEGMVMLPTSNKDAEIYSDTCGPTFAVESGIPCLGWRITRYPEKNSTQVLSDIEQGEKSINKPSHPSIGYQT